ncbi:aldo/keto reductase [Persicirhabdus sediminis]|uniref:Aldo/keto reductase n=1 Tax=Persicirhabdus sediminis TaxID=454144 RepID=A0A8J7MC49_9BACT|nr:aldo/keto reductase [Persicirhabdus sediminis]MBK1789781.1 aldo/keto reductase [Persicirhabdus sediminis]
MSYTANAARYDCLPRQRCGQSGVVLPQVSLGLWHNFGGDVSSYQAGKLLCHAFDKGIYHFDLANNYGPPPGSAEECLGKVLKSQLAGYRDELLISSKAGYDMWPGPFGDFGSRKYLVSSCDQSLKRLGLDYVDIFYHHRMDADTPLEETMGALDYIVRSGRALYVGLSNYGAATLAQASKILKKLGTPCVIVQNRYSMLAREIEGGFLKECENQKLGTVVFSPLAQGLLSDRYLAGIPAGSRVASNSPFLNKGDLTDSRLIQLKLLNEIADARGQSLAQMAIAWVLRQKAICSALIGASQAQQIDEACGATDRLDFSDDELALIEALI